MFCREQAPFTDLEQVTAAAGEAFPDFPESVLARSPHIFTPLQNCDVWDVPAAPVSVRAPVHSDVPALLLAGGLDPITPTRWAEAAATGLSRSQLIVAPAAGHDVMIWESKCATQLMDEFLDSPRHGADNSCLAEAQLPSFTTG